MGYSGLLFYDESFNKDVKSKFPVRLYHGKNDDIINFEQTVKASKVLKSLKFDSDFKLQNILRSWYRSRWSDIYGLDL